MSKYPFESIEPKWQSYWEKNKTFKVTEDASTPKEKRKYVLDMFPYPSAQGLHVGHPEGYTATDIYCRYLRMNGYKVLHPMGYDSSYKLACLYYLCMKLERKDRFGSKVTKRYDIPRTPLERVLERDDIKAETKLVLIHLKKTVPLVAEKEREGRAAALFLQIADTVPVLPIRRDFPHRG